jgi:hypothetical protein
MKHTAAPWRVDADKVSIRAGDELIAVIGGSSRYRANARLIAVAPELLNELEATDITLTNMLQVFSEKALGDAARAKVKFTRDRIRALLSRLEEQ